MPLSDSYLRLPLDAIRVSRDIRQRREIALDAGFIASIQRSGVIHPIVIERASDESGQHELIAGERRLEASRKLGLPDIPVRFADELSELEAQIIELEENCKRLNLSWQDQVRATERIHKLYKQQAEIGDDGNGTEGQAAETAPAKSWTQQDTADAISISNTLVSRYSRVAGFLDDPRIAAAKTFNEAENIIKRRAQRRSAGDLAELIGEASSDEARQLPCPILCENFLTWAPAYDGPKFNLIHCDFPYGIAHFGGPQSRGAESIYYADSADVYFTLLDCLLDNFNRLASLSCHLMFWYSGRETHLEPTMAAFRQKAPEIEFTTFPLIWLKSDNAGISPDPRRNPRHIYEVCLLGSRGGRNILQPVGDAYSAPTDHSLHASTKPEPMLRHFMRMLVDETTSLLDPTCGSAAALRAASSLGASSVLGLELDPTVAETAQAFWRDWSVLREAAGGAAGGAAAELV